MTSESDIQQLIRIRASELGMRIWRNNVGAGRLENGAFMRWGLANDSAQLNTVIKSADLIGIKPVLITADMVGQTIGQFVSLEVKHSTWKNRNTEREKAQIKWRDLILSLGGVAQIINNPEDL